MSGSPPKKASVCANEGQLQSSSSKCNEFRGGQRDEDIRSLIRRLKH